MKDYQARSPFRPENCETRVLESKAPVSLHGQSYTANLPPRGLVMHIALQGCVKAGAIPYGITADTGGHIRYLMELVEALADRPEISHQIIVTRAFTAPHLGKEYSKLEEKICEKVTIWRCPGVTEEYLPKEELWKELPQLTEFLLTKMRRRHVQPTLLHAHYADAGIVAMRIKSALGVPYVFTAHSLGATKAGTRQCNAADKQLRRRIRYEELAIRYADRIIASSEHEATAQYGLYQASELSKTVINPPGCSLMDFRIEAPRGIARQVDTELRRFLRTPDLPCVLILARPVEKKNLCALVRAFGEHAHLRHNANLIIYAGSRLDMASGEPEARRVWQEMLNLIDAYDLYGHVAYPKRHTFKQVPAIYQWALKRKGVFVNPALIEPFGLTLLEAAASGLPVVATQEGGPVDILRKCRHGVLVPPTDSQAIGNACNRLISERTQWKDYSSRGYFNVGYYTWARHVAQYISDMKQLKPSDLAFLHGEPAKRMVATDMDDTLLGDRHGLKRFASWLEDNPHCLLVVVTGRSIKAALKELKAWQAPRPDFLIADVGSSVYRIDKRGNACLLPYWHQVLEQSWQREACESLLSQHPALELQPPHAQCAHKLSYFIRAGEKAIKTEVSERLAAAGLAARVVLSHGNLLDILPPQGGKAQAVNFICELLNIDPADVVTAGDSGNDIDLLQRAMQGIVVANHTPELECLRDNPNIYWANTECANGILEGLESIEQLAVCKPATFSAQEAQ